VLGRPRPDQNGTKIQQWTIGTAAASMPNERWRLVYVGGRNDSAPNGFYEIRSQYNPSDAASTPNPAKCLDVVDGDTGENAHVQQWQCNGNEQQKWTFVDAGGGKWQIKPKHSLGDNRCLAIENASVDNGAWAVQRTCAATENSRLWYLRATEERP